jgi:hypothetical protein
MLSCPARTRHSAEVLPLGYDGALRGYCLQPTQEPRITACLPSSFDDFSELSPCYPHEGGK